MISWSQRHKLRYKILISLLGLGAGHRFPTRRCALSMVQCGPSGP